MNSRHLFVTLALAATTANAADPAAKAPTATTKGDAKPAAAPTPTEAEKAMEARWVRAMTPGAPHQALAALAGSWRYTSKVWMDPSQPPQVSDGKAEKKMILGGRFLQETVQGSMMGQPFDGVGTTGYDNVKGKLVGTWQDSMGTAIINTTGSVDAAGKVFSSTATIWDPMTDKDSPVRMVTRVVSPDRHVFEWYQKMPDGKEAMTMELTYDRVK